MGTPADEAARPVRTAALKSPAISAHGVAARPGKGPVTPGGSATESGTLPGRREYGDDTERTSHAVIRFGVALGERQWPEHIGPGRKRAAPCLLARTLAFGFPILFRAPW